MPTERCTGTSFPVFGKCGRGGVGIGTSTWVSCFHHYQSEVSQGGQKPDVCGCSRGVFMTGIWDCLFFENWWGHMWAVSPPGCHMRLTGGLKAWSHQEVQQHVSFWKLADVMTTGWANWWSSAAVELHNSSLTFSILNVLNVDRHIWNSPCY